MKSLLALFFMVVVLSGASTESKINKSKQNLYIASSQKKITDKYLSKVAKDIKDTEDDIVALEKKIDVLRVDTQKSEKKYNILKNKLIESEKKHKQIDAKLQEKGKIFGKLLSKQFSIVFAIDQAHEPTRESVMAKEIYAVYKKYNGRAIYELREEIVLLKKKNIKMSTLRKSIKNDIDKMSKKREEYVRKKLIKNELRKILASDEEKYNLKLEKIVDKQNILRSTLSKLNILHKREVKNSARRAKAKKLAIRLEKKRKREIRKEKAAARKKVRKANEALRRAKTKDEKAHALIASKKAQEEKNKVYAKSAKVRQINSSYKKSDTYAYRGGKTISPIKGGKLIKRFGTYVDPVYKIKIFNESITLKAPKSDAKVLNVLNGKVVFSGKSSMLGKVVVVSHGSKMHTVYAGLSKISPTIHVGSKIKRGYILGKVNQKLIFQATKNSKHINPLKLIKI